MSVYFITGIDTDIGKTYATGFLANKMIAEGHSVITQKMVQTGCKGISEDIITHRQLMNLPLQQVDIEGLTCPYLFDLPASPHLSSALEDSTIDPQRIKLATESLKNNYDVVLLEGAGGLMVPLSESQLTIDYIASQGYPVILVTSGRLGSINHTLLSIEALISRNMVLHTVIYNEWLPIKEVRNLDSDYPNIKNSKDDEIISQSTRIFLKAYLKQNFPKTEWIDLPV